MSCYAWLGVVIAVRARAFTGDSEATTDLGLGLKPFPEVQASGSAAEGQADVVRRGASMFFFAAARAQPIKKSSQMVGVCFERAIF